MNEYLKEVENRIKKLASKYPKSLSNNYNTDYIELAQIPVPELRKLAKEGFSFVGLDYKQKIKIWDYIWKKSSDFYVMSLALLFFDYNNKKNLSLYEWEIIKDWSLKIDNWAHSDQLSGFYAALHENYPKEIFSVYEKWNQSKNPWQRRLSLTGLYYYSSLRKKYPSFSKSKKFILNLIEDEHFYVQKAIGWLLRETYNVYPEKTYLLLKNLAAKYFLIL